MTDKREKVFADYEPKALKEFLVRNNSSLNSFFKAGIYIKGSEHLEGLGGEQAIYYANHQSMTDNFLVAKFFCDYLSEDSFPRIIAGKSLDSCLLQKIYGFDLNKTGVCWIDRDRIASNKRYLYLWAGEVGKELRSGKSYMVFPEGTRSLNRNGDIGLDSNVGFETLINSSKIDPYIVTLSFNYDMPVELPFAPLIKWGREEHSFVPKTFSQGVYKFSDALAFLTRRFIPFSSRSRTLISEPQRLSQIIGKKAGKLSAERLREVLEKKFF